MAVYEFQCSKCRKVFSAEQSFRDFDEGKKVKCPKCGSKAVTRMLSTVLVKTAKKS
jgi:putative FmdB family regulatory protein